MGIGPGAHGRISLNKNSRLVTQNRKGPSSWIDNIKKYKNGIETRKIENSYDDAYNLLMSIKKRYDG